MKNYASFIRELHDELIEAVRESEEWQFHHAERGIPEFTHYDRLVVMLSHVGERRMWYDNATKKS